MGLGMFIIKKEIGQILADLVISIARAEGERDLGRRPWGVKWL